MTAFWIKVIALISMTIDHGAYHLMEPSFYYDICRDIGRMAMPLFCFLIAEGYRHTHSIKAYFTRLFLFAVVIELLLLAWYMYSGQNYMLQDNIFLTLTSGLGILLLLKTERITYVIFAVILMVLVGFSDFDYGLYAVLMIVGFGFIKDNEYKHFFEALVIVLVNIIFVNFGTSHPFQWFSVFALIPIFLYNGKEGKKLKYFLYIYYPLHLAVIIGISTILK